MAGDRDDQRRAAERRRLAAEAAKIDARYRNVPVLWDGPLHTEAEIAAAAVEMQREVEIARGYRRPLGKKDH